ncbi:MAG: GNAT family N-acetyltransferase [Microthrixaceae bacterium]
MFETERLVVRAPVESDRLRFVEMFTDPLFTVFSNVEHDGESANARFDQMLALADVVPYAKRPVIERTTGDIVGYTGVGQVLLDGRNRLEWGWRFVPEVRGRGYATEATNALLETADRLVDGSMLCVVAGDNVPSRRVAHKVGFRSWRVHNWPGDPATYDLLIRPIGAGGAPLLAPAQPRWSS